MGKRKSTILIVCFLVFGMTLSAQKKFERQFRIRKAQFPAKALEFMETTVEDARKTRFYKEIDSSKARFETKFKKDRLRYGIEFDEEGNLVDVEIRVKEIDIPEDSFKNISTLLENEFTKYKIRRMLQQYPLEDNNTEKTLENAFQNILLPSLRYKFIVSGKKDTKYEQYQVLFDAAGNLLKLRKSLPPNYDHVLY